MIIQESFEASAQSAPAGFRACVSQVCRDFERQFRIDCSICIQFGYGTVAGSPMTGGAVGQSTYILLTSFTFAQIKAAMINNAIASLEISAAATLPATDPSGGGTYFLTQPQARALGLYTGALNIDAWVGIATSVTDFSIPTFNNVPASGLYGCYKTLCHEITECMGRLSGTNSASMTAMMLYQFDGIGSRQFTAANNRWFSFDSGVTLDPRVRFNTSAGGDAGDYVVFTPQLDACNASGATGFNQAFYLAEGSLDPQVMGCIGWQYDPSFTSPAVLQQKPAVPPRGGVIGYPRGDWSIGG